MNIDRTGISSLDAGASDITYSGNQGPKSPDQMLMASADPMLVDEYNKYVFQMEEQGQTPISFKEFVQQIMSESRQGGAYGGTAHPTYTQSRKQRMAYGGIAGLDGRRKNGIGSWFQEKIKDPLERAFTGIDVEEQKRRSQERVDAEDLKYGEGWENPLDTFFKGQVIQPVKDSLTSNLEDQRTGGASRYLIPMAIGAAAGKTQADWLKDQPQSLVDPSGIDIADIRSRALTGSDPGLHFLPPAEATTAYAQGGRTGYAAGDRVKQDVITAFSTYINAGVREDFNKWFTQVWLPESQGIASLPSTTGYEGTEGMGDYPMEGDIDTRELIYGMPSKPVYAAQGGRIGKAEGGLMDLGGMEKDYRQEGCFVPIGGQERADDVPARLSKNEFVFTADAVRNAGGGDIDAGAEVMENLMENLEQGGNISEESQGLEGARNMFATSQRLEGVL